MLPPLHIFAVRRRCEDIRQDVVFDRLCCGSAGFGSIRWFLFGQRMYINYGECSSITITRNENNINCSYYLNQKYNLGSQFNSWFGHNFDRHDYLISSSCLRMSGYMKEKFSNFTSVISLKMLYIYFILIIIWEHYLESSVLYLWKRMERVQRKFLRFICNKSNLAFSNVNVTPVLNHFNMISLENRRVIM